MYSVPREQLVRPGQRRYLMRRALVGIVPDELLNRKRKAFVARAPLAAIWAEWTRLSELSQHMVSSALSIVEAKAFLEALQTARQGQEVPTVTVMRTLGIERWLRHLKDWNFFSLPTFFDSRTELTEGEAGVELTTEVRT